MNKILISFLLALFVCESYAEDIAIIKTCNSPNDCGTITLDEIKQLNKPKYKISDSYIVMDGFSQWQDWDADVEIDCVVNLYVNNLDGVENNTIVKHVKAVDSLKLKIIDKSNLYKTNLQSLGEDVYVSIVRETNYEKIFNGSRGKYLENIRSKNPNDKMLLAMDNAKSMNEINSIMNSSYRFNPIILMRPIKTINRADLFNVNTDNFNTGANVRVGYLTSDKIGDMNARFNIGNVYKDLYFNIGVNIDTFVFDDNEFNKFDGFAYGADFEIRKYFDNLWFGGLAGVRRALFKTDDIYSDGNVSANPKGLSEYARISIGYDYNNIDNLKLSPFAGLVFQNVDISGMSDSNINLIVGTKIKHDFTIDGIKYEYGLSIAGDEKAKWYVGGDIGFVSVADNVGGAIKIDAFKDEFDDINYQISINAKIDF